MASGRRDYSFGFVNEAGNAGRFVNRWGKIMNKSVEGKATDELYSYTMPAGYRRGIILMHIHGGTAGGNSLQVRVAGSYVYYMPFDRECIVQLSNENIIYYTEGQELEVKVYNADTVAAYFVGYMLGITETLT